MKCPSQHPRARTGRTNPLYRGCPVSARATVVYDGGSGDLAPAWVLLQIEGHLGQAVLQQRYVRKEDALVTLIAVD